MGPVVGAGADVSIALAADGGVPAVDVETGGLCACSERSSSRLILGIGDFAGALLIAAVIDEPINEEGNLLAVFAARVGTGVPAARSEGKQQDGVSNADEKTHAVSLSKWPALWRQVS